MKQLLLLFIAVSALFGVEINEASLDDSIKKCNARDKIACREVSRFYYEVFRKASFRDEEAMKLWVDYALKACELRDGESCYSVSHHYDKRGGYPRLFDENTTKREEYLIKGCDYNSTAACNSLGHLYYMESLEKSGKEKKTAELKSKQFYKKACKLGSKLACKR